MNCTKDGELFVSAAELVALSLHRYASETANDRDDFSVSPLPSDDGAGPEWRLACGDYTVIGRADAFSPPQDGAAAVITLRRAVHCDARFLPKEILSRLRGEGYAIAHLFFVGSPAAQAVTLVLSVRGNDGGEDVQIEESVTPARAAKFFARLTDAAAGVAAFELARARRLHGLRRLPFPYRDMRTGQGDLMNAVFRTVRRGGRLFACAPTGIGKTAAVLYPALRALGEGYTDRIFYLTPKGTTARAAADALCRFRRAGAGIYGITLAAKERLCPRGCACRTEKSACPVARAGGAQEERAAMALLALDLPVVGEEEVGRTAATFAVCPYELSLRYSMFCDVIIGDYNYLFDTRAYLRRYFDKEGNYCFLIDEAHDLPDRAREMYSASLSLASLSAFEEQTRPESATLADAVRAAADAFRHTVAPLKNERTYTDKAGRVCAFASEKSAPERLTVALSALLSACEAVMGDRRVPYPFRRTVRENYYVFRDFLTRTAYYDSRYETFLLREGDAYTVRVVCLDPARAVDACLSRGRSAVLFSATLEPMDYYRALLGGARGSVELQLESPFDPDHLSVSVMDKISTRFAARQESAPQIAAVIAAMADARVGNYFVFCPSFTYMEEIAAAYRALRPHVQTVVQARRSTTRERDAFLARFTEDPTETFVGFGVTGGVYAEGVDLSGTRLIGAAVVGVGLPQPSPERDAMCAYFDDLYERGKEYAYAYPGMNRVLQAAGRVIRGEEDRGVLILLDDRFAEPLYRRAIPHQFHGLKYVGDTRTLSVLLRRFWEKNP